MKQRFRVFLLDDDLGHARPLAHRLATHGYDAHALPDPDELFRRLQSPAPACVILERTVDGARGMEIFETIAAGEAPATAVFLVRDGDVADCARAMRRGAVDYLTKPAPMADLLDALRRAEALSRERHRVCAERALVRERLARLTPREHEVLQLVLAGHRNKQIAFELSSQEATVKVHRSRLMRKLETRSLAELLRLTTHLHVERAKAGDARVGGRARQNDQFPYTETTNDAVLL